MNQKAARDNNTFFLVLDSFLMFRIEVSATHLIITEYGGDEGGPPQHEDPDTSIMWKCFIDESVYTNSHSFRLARSTSAFDNYIDTWYTHYSGDRGLPQPQFTKLALFPFSSCTFGRHASPGGGMQCLALSLKQAAYPLRTLQVPDNVMGDSKANQGCFRKLFQQMLTVCCEFQQSNRFAEIPLSPGWPYND